MFFFYIFYWLNNFTILFFIIILLCFMTQKSGEPENKRQKTKSSTFYKPVKIIV